MAGNNGLIFPIKFDFEGALGKAEKDVQNAVKIMEGFVKNSPLKVEVDSNNLKYFQGAVGAIKPELDKAITSSTELNRIFSQYMSNFKVGKTSLEDMKNLLKMIEERWQKMSMFQENSMGKIKQSGRFLQSGDLSTESTELLKMYSQVEQAIDLIGKTMKNVTADAKKSIKEQEREEAQLLKTIQRINESLAKQYADEAKASNKLKNKQRDWEAKERQKVETNYSNWWNQELGKREKAEADFIQKRRNMAQKATDEVEKQLERERSSRARQMEQKKQELAILQTQPKTLSEVNAQLAIRNRLLNQKEIGTTAWQKQADEIKKLTILAENMKQKMQNIMRGSVSQMPDKSISDITAKINAYRDIMNKSNFGSPAFTSAQTEVIKLTTKLEKMNKVMAETEKQRVFQQALSATSQTLEGLNAKLSAWNSKLQGLKIGTDEWKGAADMVRKYTDEIQKANQHVQDFQQKAFKGLGSNLTTTQVDKVQKLRSEIEKLDVQYNKLNASNKAFNPNGSLTKESVDILTKRATKQKELNDIIRDAEQAQRKYDEELKKAEEIQRKIAEAQKRRTDTRSMLNSNESRMSNVSAKLEYYQSLIQKQQVGSTGWNRSADEINRLTTKLAEFNKELANKQQLATWNKILQSVGNTIESLNAKLSVCKEQINKFNFGSAQWQKAALDARRYSEELERVNRWAVDYNQKAFQGLGDNLTNHMVGRLQTIRGEIQHYKEQLNQLNATGGAYKPNGTLTPQASKITADLIAKEKELSEITRTSESATKAFNEELRKQEEIQRKLAEAHKRHVEELKKMRQALNANEERMVNLSAKLQIYQNLVQKQQIGSEGWNKSALEIQRISIELERANQRLQDFQQKAFRGLLPNDITNQVSQLTQWRDELTKIDAKIHEIQQLRVNTNAPTAMEVELNTLLDQRIAKNKQIGEILRSASDLALDRERKLKEETDKRAKLLEDMRNKEKAHDQAKGERRARLEAEKRRKAAGELTEEQKRQQRILQNQSQSINAINAKLKFYQDKLNRQEFGSSGFKKTCEEIRKCSEELKKYQAEIDRLTGKTKVTPNPSPTPSPNPATNTTQIKATTEAFREQTTYIERLIKRMAVYASFGMAINFAKQIANTTAQFELQKVSLGAIIQDQRKANELFGQIKAFAQKSPVSILDLTTYTKQVAAYRIESDKLFDTTKRLADVSVGLGVDMGRIVLAYGQVKAATFLRASEVRQFTEAGIPLLELLADKFTELEGKSVSAGEVMDRISKKMVTFSMLEDVFKRMTDEGGIFYNMQEKQGNTLYGMMQKMGDAAQVMYDQIGSGANANAIIKGLISVATNAMKHWEAFANVIATVALGFGIYKAAMAGLVPLYDLNTKSIIRQTIAEKNKVATNVQTMAIGRQLTTQEMRLVTTKNMLTAAEWKEILTSSKLSALQKINLARQAAYNAELRKGCIESKLFNEDQLRTIANMSALKFAGLKLQAVFRGIGDTLRNFGTMMVNALPMMALTAVIQLAAEWKLASNAQKEAVEEVNKAYDEQYIKILAIQNAYEDIIAIKKSSDQTDEEFAAATFSSKLEQLNKLRDVLGSYNMKNAIDVTLVDKDNIDGIITTWINKLNEVNKVARDAGTAVANVANAYEGTIMGWSLFGENLKSDLADIEESFTKMSIDGKFKDDLRYVQEKLDYMENHDKKQYNQLSKQLGMDAKLALSSKHRNESELDYQKRIHKNFQAIANTLGYIDKVMNSLGLSSGYERDLQELQHEFDKFKDAFKGQDALTVRMAIDDIAARNEWTDWQKQELIDYLNKEPITINAEIIPKESPSGTLPIYRGMKQIISTEFPSLFNPDELSNLNSIDAIMEAINEKIASATKGLETASMLENRAVEDSKWAEKSKTRIDELQADITKWSTAQNELAKLNNIEGDLTQDQLDRKRELEEYLLDVNEDQINAKKDEIVAIVNANEAYDEQIKKLKEANEENRKLAESAKERLISSGLSSLAKDAKANAGDMYYKPSEHIGDKDFSGKFLISDEDLSKVKDLGDLYDLWASRTKSLAEERKKLANAGITEATVAREQAALEAKKVQFKVTLNNIEKQLTSAKYSQLYAEYEKLRVQWMQTKDSKERARLQAEMKKILGDQKNAAFAKLLIDRANTQELMRQGLIAAAANKQQATFLKSLNDAESGLKSWQQRYNFRLQEGGNKGRGGSGEDWWITLMKNRIKYMQDFQKGVEDYNKFMKKQKAIGDERENMMGRGLSLGFKKDFINNLEGSDENLIDYYEYVIKEITKKITKLGGKTWSGLGVQAIMSKDTKSKIIKKYQEFLAEVYKQLTDFRTDQFKKELEEKMKALAEEVSRTKTAKDFYNKILDQTGDLELSAKLAVNIYGMDGSDLFDKEVEEIRNAFESNDITVNLNIESVFDYKNQIIDYAKLRYIADNFNDLIVEKKRETAKRIANEGTKAMADQITTWQKELSAAKSYEQQRTDILDKATRERENIIKTVKDPEERNRLVDLSVKKESQDLSNLDAKEFTQSERYIKIFENLDNTATESLRRLREELARLIITDKELSPQNVKTLVKAMDDIDKQLNSRGIGGEMINAYQKWKVARDNKRIAQSEYSVVKSNYDSMEPSLNQEINTARIEEAKIARELADLKRDESASQADIVAKELQLNSASNKVAKAEQKKRTEAEKVRKAYNKVLDCSDEIRKSINDFFAGMSAVSDKASKLSSVLSDTKELLEISEDSSAGIVFDSAIDGLKQMQTMLSILTGAQVLLNAVTAANPIVAIAAAALALGTFLFNFLRKNKTAGANREIEKQKKLIEELEYAYNKLQKVSEKVFGNDFLETQKEMYANLEATSKAYLKQAELERSKGKDADKAKIEEYEKSYRDSLDKLTEAHEDFVSKILGSDVAGVAKDFAQAWIEAYKSFSNTSKSMQTKFKELIDNMITNHLVTQVMSIALKPFIDEIEKLKEESDFYNANFWDNLTKASKESTTNAENMMNQVLAFLKNAGINIRTLGNEATGITRNIATASEESINGLAAGINTQNFYISHVPTISENVAAIRQILATPQAEQKITQQTGENGWSDWERQAMDNLGGIKQNTAEILAECQKSANYCKNVSEKIDRVVAVKGQKQGINVFMN